MPKVGDLANNYGLQLFLLSFVHLLALVVGAATFSTFFLGFTNFQDAADTDGLGQPKHVTMIIGRSSATIHYQLDGWRLSLGVLPSLSIPYWFDGGGTGLLGLVVVTRPDCDGPSVPINTSFLRLGYLPSLWFVQPCSASHLPPPSLLDSDIRYPSPTPHPPHLISFHLTSIFISVSVSVLACA